jgi:hypothetical protein
MTATQMTAFVIMSETLQGLIDQESKIQADMVKKIDDLEQASIDRDCTDLEERQLEEWNRDADRASDNEADLDSIQEAIECLMHEERGNPR